MFIERTRDNPKGIRTRKPQRRIPVGENGGILSGLILDCLGDTTEDAADNTDV